jgi:hypothetical protein
MNRSETLRTLRAIDWDFALPRSGYVAPPHWYPGTFVPQLSDALIEALSPIGGRVFDPYSGIGTTGWSAIRSGRNSVLADINPVGLLVGYSTTSLLALARQNLSAAKSVLGALARLTGKNQDLFGIVDSSPGLAVDQLVTEITKPAPLDILRQTVASSPQLESLGPWIHPETLASLRDLLSRLEASPSAYVQVAGLSMISAIARAVSSQHASWGHIADNVRPRELKKQDIEAALRRWLRRADSFISNIRHAVGSDDRTVTSSVYRIDWSAEGNLGARDCDLMLTSPPYADAIDYALAQRLSLYLLGYSDQQIGGLVKAEIGARRKRSKTDSRQTWARQLCDALPDQLSWLYEDASICVVLPHKDAGRSAGEDELRVALQDLGWSLVFERDRSIHQSHTRQSWTSIKRETILVFSRS